MGMNTRRSENKPIVPSHFMDIAQLLVAATERRIVTRSAPQRSGDADS